MTFPREPQTAAAGFSNQQALLVLFIAFPIGLIGLGLVITLGMRPQEPQVTRAPQVPRIPIEEPAIEEQPTIIEETPNPVELPMPTPQPLANQARSSSNNGSTCWFQMETGGGLIGNRCSVSQRINVNGDRVFDVVEPSGLTRSVVLWENKEAEVFLQGQRFTGNWSLDDDGDVRVRLPSGTFAFKPLD